MIRPRLTKLDRHRRPGVAAVASVLLVAGPDLHAATPPTPPPAQEPGQQPAQEPAKQAAAATLSSETSAAGFTFRVSVEPGAGEVGTPFTLTLALRTSVGRPASSALDGVIDLAEPLGDFHVERIDGPRIEGDVLVARYRLTTFGSGPLVFPPLVVALPATDAADAAPTGVRTLASQPLTITVASLFNEWDEVPTHLRPLKPPVERIEEVSRWPLIVGLSSVAALCLGAVALLLRRLLRPGPPPPAHAVALQALDALAGDGLAATGRVHEFHVRLTDIVRHYIEDRFGIRAPERTTPEFLAEARASDAFTEDQRRRLAELLTAADRVKFGGVRPDATSCEGSLASARAFVTETVPSAEEVRR